MNGDGGNAGAAARDNRFVQLSIELMGVVQDLCSFAAAFRAAGEIAWAETLIEQGGELLAHRAWLICRSARAEAGAGSGSCPPAAFSPRGSGWTN
jgi:hypothetical protein